ncbi:huntingtin [Ditylenchus destructor]|nr:huntingtin [Ditylenchus destructor]
MSSKLDKLSRAVLTLESSLSAVEPKTATILKKKNDIHRRDRQACQDIKDILTSWNSPHLQKIDLHNAIEVLFNCLDHKESTIRILADQTIDAIFRKYQIKFQPQRVIALLLTVLSRKCSARTFCGALNKLTVAIPFYRSQRAGAYVWHFMTSICAAIHRPEESIQSAIEKCFPIIFSKIGPFVEIAHVEKAEDLFQTALLNLDLSGASNRAACAVIASLAKFVPSILHKSFYKLTSIIFAPDDAQHKARLVGALNTFRLMWDAVIKSLTEFSLATLQKLLCKVLCCLYSSSNEVIVAALELLQCAIANTPFSILDFDPFTAQGNPCSSVFNSPYHATFEEKKRCLSKAESGEKDHELVLVADELESVLATTKSPWTSMNDICEGLASDTFGYDDLDSIADYPNSSRASQTTDEPREEVEDTFSVVADIMCDPLLHCENYASIEDMAMLGGSASRDECATPPSSNTQTDAVTLSKFGEASEVTSKIVDFLPDDFCNGETNFYTYSALTLARHFLLAGLSKGLKNDSEVRISVKILSLNVLSAIVTKYCKAVNQPVFTTDGQQFITDIQGFLGHDDDILSLAVLEFFMRLERSAFYRGKSNHPGRILSMTSQVLQNRNPIRLKGAFHIFAQSVRMIVADDHLLSAVCEYTISTFECDYFLIKIARTDLLSKIRWSHASPHCRQCYQQKCVELFLKHFFDSDTRVIKATSDALPHLVRNAEYSYTQSNIFNSDVPEWFGTGSVALRKIPMVLGMNPQQYSFRSDPSDCLIEHNLSHIIKTLISLCSKNMSHTQTGFLLCLTTLADSFPPCLYSEAWFSFAANSKTSTGLLTLLLDISESTCSTLQELTALLKLVSYLTAGTAESSVMKAIVERNQNVQSYGLSGFSDISIQEMIIVFYLRVFNLYYTIVAEEKIRHASNLNTSLFPHPNIIVPFSPKAGEIKSPVPDSHAFSTPNRTNNLSFLVGTDVKMTRESSFLKSSALKSIEPTLRGAYKNFLDSINPDTHRRFLEPLEAAMEGLCIVMEVMDFRLLRSFLEELLLYMKSLFDINVDSTARLIHQCLKVLFHRNAYNVNLRTVQSLRIKEPTQPTDDLLEMYLLRNINEFTIFAAFVNRSEFMEIHVLKDAGWMPGNSLRPITLKSDSQHLKEVANALGMFDVFITRLIQVYTLSNSSSVRSSILEVLTSLTLSNVRYDVIDENKKLYRRVVDQLQQLHREDLALIPSAIQFLLCLCRANYTTFAEVEHLFSDVLTRLDENNVLQILEAVHIYLVYFMFYRKPTLDSPEGRPTRLKDFLCKEFDFLFSHAPSAASHLWILFLNLARSSKDNDYWTEVSFDFLTHFISFLQKKPANSFDYISRLSSSTPYQISTVLSCCSPSVFRPIDQFYNCLEGILAQTSTLTKSDSVQILPKALPLLFILICQLDENVVLLRLNAINKDAVDFLARSVVEYLIRFTQALKSNDINPGLEDALVFLIQILLHALRSGKCHQIIHSLKSHMTASLQESERNISNTVQLSQAFPKAHAYWFSLLLALDYVSPSQPELYFSETYLSHTKTLVNLLMVQKICDKDKISESKYAGILSQANEEFCIRLLKLCGTSESKNCEKIFSQLPGDILQKIILKQTHFFHSNHMEALMPAYKNYLERSHSIFESNLCEGNVNITLALLNTIVFTKNENLEEILKLANKFMDSTSTSPNFSTKMIDFEFYAVHAGSANGKKDFHKICAVIHLFDSMEACAIIRKIPKHLRMDFLDVLFEWLRAHTCAAIGDAQLKDLAFPSVNCTNPSQTLLDAIVTLLATPDIFAAEEYIFIMARMSELSANFFAIQEDFLEDNIERILNEAFVEFLMVKRLEKKIVTADYFKALCWLFNLPLMLKSYENDYYLVTNLRQLIGLLWEECLSKELHKWQRLTTGDKHWDVQVEADSHNNESLEEEVLQLFNVIQKIAHAFKNNLIKDTQKELAFKTILRLPLLSRMCVVPEYALRLDWRLVISCREDKISIPLVSIHMLNEPGVLHDFVWRILWLGWTSRSQFEEFWMSMFGVLSSTPTAIDELAAAAENQNVYQQIEASSIAVEALSNLLLQTLLYPQPGNTANSRFLVKHRNRKENNLFLESMNGKLASVSKMWIEYNDEPGSAYIKNLEFCETDTAYGLGQTSVYYLWSITGLLETNEQQINCHMKSTVSHYLIQMSTELDTASSLKALFENYIHWCSNGFDQLPIPLLSATLKSLCILSDLFDDVTYYYFIFSKLKALHNSKYLDEHPAKGYLIHMLLKCAAVVEWKELFDSSVTTEADFVKYLEYIVENGLHFSQFTFVRYCALHGILNLLQSFALDSLINVVTATMDFVMAELRNIQRPTDILTESSFATIEYQKVVWAVAFRVLEEALPIDSMHKSNFINLVCELFIDPRIATWQKQLLSRGMESLIVHSCSYSPKFRQTALECFDTYQLRPLHLKYALSVYTTCIFKEIQEGGEFAYAINKTFEQEFQKLLNV